MSIHSQKFSLNKLKDIKESVYLTEAVLPGEIEGVYTDLIAIKGPCSVIESARTDIYDVLLILGGNGSIQITGEKFQVYPEFIVRIPFGKMYRIQIQKGTELYFLKIRKVLDNSDRNAIDQSPEFHSMVYAKRFSDCPTYSEDIKSAATINRMLLPENYIPRFCMGSVETQGPDTVDSHEHPMLEQLFLGLENCKCTCYADNDQTLLTENMLLHIPLGSRHSVSVAKGDKLAYIWLDFFLTLKGQQYMDAQHTMNDQ